MMQGVYRSALLASSCCFFFASPSNAAGQTTTTYSYDALGRLKTSSIAGGANDGLQTSTIFDSAGNRSNYTVSGATSAPAPTPTPTPTLAIGNATTVAEGGSLLFHVTKSGTTTSSVTVQYATASGTATAGSDYTATSGTLTFAAADTSKTITVATIDDSAVESTETVLVNLSSPSGATISDAQGSGSITDNDSSLNHSPVAVDDTANFTLQDTSDPIVLNVLNNDTDSDGDTLTVLSVNGGTHFILVAGAVRFRNVLGQTGIFPATYVISDGHGATSTANIIITVS